MISSATSLVLGNRGRAWAVDLAPPRPAVCFSWETFLRFGLDLPTAYFLESHWLATSGPWDRPLPFPGPQGPLSPVLQGGDERMKMILRVLLTSWRLELRNPQTRSHTWSSGSSHCFRVHRGHRGTRGRSSTLLLKITTCRATRQEPSAQSWSDTEIAPCKPLLEVCGGTQPHSQGHVHQAGAHRHVQGC